VEEIPFHCLFSSLVVVGKDWCWTLPGLSLLTISRFPLVLAPTQRYFEHYPCNTDMRVYNVHLSALATRDLLLFYCHGSDSSCLGWSIAGESEEIFKNTWWNRCIAVIYLPGKFSYRSTSKGPRLCFRRLVYIRSCPEGFPGTTQRLRLRIVWLNWSWSEHRRSTTDIGNSKTFCSMHHSSTYQGSHNGTPTMLLAETMNELWWNRALPSE